ncbi:hypothetical protein RIF29_35830 [Crotalaria pallida]|uniref:RING-type E3 ubiquitin transferase n=1 Tax=Crotalaria pallida TaxID=3830 RepID=A0AAN9EGK9_CROPI
MVFENNGDAHGNFQGTGATVTLAATLSLFGIILVIIVIYFYAKHHLRHQHRARQQNLLHRISTQIAHANVNSPVSLNSGLDPQVIASIPKFLYKETNQFIQGEVTECSVCLGTILGDETIRVLPNCKHMFHINCVDEWFISHGTCPVCRAAVEPKVQPGDDDHQLAAQVQPTAPPVEEGVGVSVDDTNHELGCSGLRMASFPRIVISRERSLRMSSDGSVAVEDIEKQ